MFRKRLLPHLVYWFYRVWSSTWRLTLEEPSEMKDALQKKSPFILAHWHGDELALIHLARRYRIATMTSTSKDGELMNTVVTRLGAKTSRGSSTRGGTSALKGLLRLIKDGHNASMAVDGPKGPLHKAKPGIFELSRLAKAPIFTAGVAYSKAFVFEKSWNKAHLPKPFAKIVIKWQGPIASIDKKQDPRSENLAQDLETSIHTAHQQALKLIVENIGQC